MIEEDNYEVPKAITGIARVLAGGRDSVEFLPNGARVYPDVGNIEYATPECLGPRQLACAEIA